MNQKPLVGSVQEEALSLLSIVQQDFKAPRSRDDEFHTFFVSMAASSLAPRNVICVVDALDLKRYMTTPLKKGEVSTRIGNLGELDDARDSGWGAFCQQILWMCARRRHSPS